MSRTGTHALLRRITQTIVLLGTLMCARPALADPLTVMWDFNSEPDVTGYLVYIGTQPGVYAQSVDVRNTNSYVFNSAVSGRRYYFAVAAYAGNLVSALSAEVSAVGTGTGNQAPTLANPGNQSSRVGQSVLLQLSGSDPESGLLTYSASGLPAGLILTTASGRIAGVPITPGTYSVIASVSDGALVSQRSFTWVISSSTTSLGGSQEPTIDHSLSRHASSASTFTGTVATTRPAEAPETMRTILRLPNQPGAALGSSSESGVSANSYSGTSASVRTVAIDEPADARTYTGRSALPRPLEEASAGSQTRSGPSTNSILRDSPRTEQEPSEEDGSGQPASTQGGPDTNLVTAAPRRPATSAPSSAPMVSIETPVDRVTFAAGTTVIFSVVALDVEDGNLSAQVVWTSSVDGRIGTGALLSRVLSSGSHTITASVTDSKGNTRTAQVSVTVQ